MKRGLATKDLKGTTTGKILEVSSVPSPDGGGFTIIETDKPTGTFDGLTDTPSSKTGAAGKMVVVNPGGTALEYVTAPPGTGVGGIRLHIDFDQLRTRYRAIFKGPVRFDSRDMEGEVLTLYFQLVVDGSSKTLTTDLAVLNTDITTFITTATKVYSVIVVAAGNPGWQVGGAYITITQL